MTRAGLARAGQAGLTLLAAVAPQHWASVGVFALAAATGAPALCAAAAVAGWWGAWTGPAGAAWLVGAAACAALGGRRGAWGVLGLGAVVAARQQGVSGSLGAAAGVVPGVAALAVLGAGAWPEGGRAPATLRLALAALAVVSGARVAAVWRAEGVDRLHAAQTVHAERLVVSGLVGHDAAMDAALIAAVPDCDAAAAGLGWRRALALGWRPVHPDADVVSIARALDADGRGGEARRLLARYPRTGPVDFWRAAFERLDGRDGWRGGLDGEPALVQGGVLALDWGMVTNGGRERVLRVDAPVRACLDARAEAFEGDPEVEVRLDAAQQRWVPAGALDLGVLAPGPHTLRLRYDTDLRRMAGDPAGPPGDRNVWVDGLRGVPAGQGCGAAR